ncbi:hypothetical protein LTR78_005888 [Recurvomyces mirabilis]|uniref:Uncharacterized protein n=1 Tax=Recurvomyces mirabilis TaxID=574656 RepID=A0AAE0WMD6_9PEZI|nr:hypothetical protein LTR78_005888 [Recurvomyces mirabilis]KAK5154269.1 hypothetical protein LTS14_006954 [Recurvomyces mirabilis]
MAQASAQIGDILQSLINGFKTRLLEVEQSRSTSDAKFSEFEEAMTTFHAKVGDLANSDAKLRDVQSSLQTALTVQQAGHALVCEDIRGIQESQQRLNNRLDAVTSWRDTMNTKIERAEAKAVAADTATSAANNELAEIKRQVQDLQDIVAKQDRNLESRLQSCETALDNSTLVLVPTPTANGLVLTVQRRHAPNELGSSSKSRSSVLDVGSHGHGMAILPRPGDSNVSEFNCLVNTTAVDQSTVGPGCADTAPYDEGAVGDPGMLPMRSRTTRYSSIDSSVTLCNDRNPQRKLVPQSGATKPQVPAFPSLREQSEYRDECACEDVHHSIEATIDVPLPLIGHRVSDHTVRASKRHRSGSHSSSENDQSSKAPSACYFDTNQDGDGDEIVVASGNQRAKTAGAKQTLNALDSADELLPVVHKPWGIGGRGKEKVPTEEDDVNIAEKILYDVIRRSGRGLKPKRRYDDNVGVNDDQSMHAEDIATEPKKSRRSVKSRKPMI